jgi:hypothetical protein
MAILAIYIYIYLNTVVEYFYCRCHLKNIHQIVNKHFEQFFTVVVNLRLNSVLFRGKSSLKVDGNEKRGGSGRRQQISFSLPLWRSRVILNLNVSFLCKQSISISACYSLIYRQCLDKQVKRSKFFTFLYIGADVFIS